MSLFNKIEIGDTLRMGIRYGICDHRYRCFIVLNAILFNQIHNQNIKRSKVLLTEKRYSLVRINGSNGNGISFCPKINTALPHLSFQKIDIR